MDNQSIKEILNGLYSHLERLETQNTAILLFLKEKKRVTDKQLAPYLEQAGNAANVKWRAERVRMEYLLAQASEETKPDEKSEKESAASPEIEQNRSASEKKSPAVEQKTSDQKEQVAEDSGKRDDLKERAKASSGESSEVEHVEQKTAQETSEQKPEQEHQDSNRPAEIQAESAHEPSDEKEADGKKVA